MPCFGIMSNPLFFIWFLEGLEALESIFAVPWGSLAGPRINQKSYMFDCDRGGDMLFLLLQFGQPPLALGLGTAYSRGPMTLRGGINTAEFQWSRHGCFL